MKRENLQRANEAEARIKVLEGKLKTISDKPFVLVNMFSTSATPTIKLLADNLSGDPYDRDAFVFLQNVRERMRNEIDSLLKEMEGL